MRFLPGLGLSESGILHSSANERKQPNDQTQFNLTYISFNNVCLLKAFQNFIQGSAVAWWLMPRTPDPEVGGSSPTRVKPCCVLEQGTYTPQKVLVIPRKRWLRPNMTEKLFTGTLRINQPTKTLSIFTNNIILDDIAVA